MAKCVQGRRLLLLVILFFIVTTKLFAQVVMPLMQLESKHDVFFLYKAEVEAGKVYEIQVPRALTGLVIKVGPDQQLEGATIATSSELFKLERNMHDEVEGQAENQISSQLIIFNSPVSELRMFSASLAGTIEIHGFYAGESIEKKSRDKDSSQLKSTPTDCDKPATIDQSVWREGLPVPSYTPKSNNVKHLIIHHSATSNTATDYKNVVRNIYLYHTQSNKWSDIGYNYLIAPDGSIFEGREDFGQMGEDNVLGAHFCGKNTGAMGVCLLGNYSENVEPTAIAINSLVNLLSWKVLKEDLNPLANAWHPEGRTDATPLGIIAGHRDGCATECPGTNVYKRLPLIRNEVNTVKEECEGKGNIVASLSIIPNPASDETKIKIEAAASIKRIKVYDIRGRLVFLRNSIIYANEYILNTSGWRSGMYIISVSTDLGVKNGKLVVIN